MNKRVDISFLASHPGTSQEFSSVFLFTFASERNSGPLFALSSEHPVLDLTARFLGNCLHSLQRYFHNSSYVYQLKCASLHLAAELSS